MTHYTIHKDMQIDDIMTLPLSELDLIKQELEEAINDLDAYKDKLDDALNMRFMRKTQQLLNKDGRDSGTVHFEEEEYEVTVNLPKKVVWDQEKLAAIIQDIPQTERDKYIDTIYKIHEQHYLMYCPLHLRDKLDQAREVTTTKPKFKFKEIA